MSKVANWIAERPYTAGGSLIGFIVLVAAIGFENSIALLNMITGA